MDNITILLPKKTHNWGWLRCQLAVWAIIYCSAPIFGQTIIDLKSDLDESKRLESLEEDGGSPYWVNLEPLARLDLYLDDDPLLFYSLPDSLFTKVYPKFQKEQCKIRSVVSSRNIDPMLFSYTEYYSTGSSSEISVTAEIFNQFNLTCNNVEEKRIFFAESYDGYIAAIVSKSSKDIRFIWRHIVDQDNHPVKEHGKVTELYNVKIQQGYFDGTIIDDDDRMFLKLSANDKTRLYVETGAEDLRSVKLGDPVNKVHVIFKINYKSSE